MWGSKAKPPVFAWPTALLLWCFLYFSVANRMHDIFMPHVVLEGSGIMSIIGELVAG
jgi:hypothetical protein